VRAADVNVQVRGSAHRHGIALRMGCGEADFGQLKFEMRSERSTAETGGRYPTTFSIRSGSPKLKQKPIKSYVIRTG
jgi:hypothetical protein